MVKAELSYNPYLLETKIKFNGHEPRINSLVEKYQQETLQNWMKKIPSIFYDEMNGYDFELEFSGTKLEFEALNVVFVNAGVTEEMVRRFHKNELDCRKSKTEKIDELMKWFTENPNRKFDYDAFIEQNAEFFRNEYICVLLNGPSYDFELSADYVVSIENIETVNELDNTSLSHTPIIIWIDENTLSKMKSNLRYLFNRKDVEHNQLFFFVQPELNMASIERTIHDLGIDRPQLITSMNDSKIGCYLETYPVTDYIYEAIKILRDRELEIANVLAIENEESMVSNREIHNQIDELEDVIRRLKTALSLFVNRDNLDVLPELETVKENFLNSIQNWKNKKTKITKEYEAISLAQNLDSQVQKMYMEFCRKIDGIFTDTQCAIELEFKNWYEGAEYEAGFTPDISCVKNNDYKEIPTLTNKLLEMKEEKYVTPKEDFFGMLFKSSSEKEVESVLQVTFDCQEWRRYAIEISEPIVCEVIQEYEMILKTYVSELAELYKAKLDELIKERTTIKEKVSAQLSDDEQKLQEDNDWLVCFQDQLRAIERG